MDYGLLLHIHSTMYMCTHVHCNVYVQGDTCTCKCVAVIADWQCVHV